MSQSSDSFTRLSAGMLCSTSATIRAAATDSTCSMTTTGRAKSSGAPSTSSKPIRSNPRLLEVWKQRSSGNRAGRPIHAEPIASLPGVLSHTRSDGLSLARSFTAGSPAQALSANSSRLESHQLARTIDGHNVVLEVAVAKDNPIALQLLLRSGVLLQDRNYGVLHDLR